MMIAALTLPSLASANTLDWANGSWAYDPETVEAEQLEKFNCETNPMAVSIEPRNKRYQSKHQGHDPEKANILESGSNYITIKYDGEERTMDDGSLHIWNMIFLDQDHFIWVREDWIQDDGSFKGGTSIRVRCLAPNT